ncbi:phospholipase D-like domain-containing protein [Acidisoma silvae]|uniref:Phospholipase D n=1 Tax=Acidisoma silvae TaxID=2802396 RepID=A0A963YP31_9PROT|nr:phospholipase D-like domain-containing protein [Acidisoma silvae]MCB8874167.1 cardiolipin synthase [Acidisoma silvae]
MDSEHEIAWIGSARAIVEPEDTTQPVLDLINGAHTTICLKMFTFTADDIAEALIAAQQRGVLVRIMLNPARSSGSRANDDMKARLQKGGITVAWSSPAFAVTHEKSMVVDSRVALIATFNFGVKYFTTTRDYGIVTTDAEVIAEMESCFEADWSRKQFVQQDRSALIWSNRGSRALMCHFIDMAEHTLDVQHPKFVDAVVLDRIIQANERGVRVRVLCGGKHGISTWDVLDTFASLRLMKLHGVKIRKQKGLRLHAKLLLADDKHAIVGSMNIDRSAFDLRRELGCFINDLNAVERLSQTFSDDWHEAKRYDPPDPLTVELIEEDDHPHDSELVHE